MNHLENALNMNIICWNIMYGIDRPLYGGSLEVFVLFSEKKMRKLLCAADQQMNEQDGTVQPLMCRKGEQRSEKSATTVTDVTIKFVFCPIVFFFCGVFSFSLYFFFHSLRFIGPMSIVLLLLRRQSLSVSYCKGDLFRVQYFPCAYVTITFDAFIYGKLNGNQIKTHG